MQVQHISNKVPGIARNYYQELESLEFHGSQGRQWSLIAEYFLILDAKSISYVPQVCVVWITSLISGRFESSQCQAIVRRAASRICDTEILKCGRDRFHSQG